MTTPVFSGSTNITTNTTYVPTANTISATPVAFEHVFYNYLSGTTTNPQTIATITCSLSYQDGAIFIEWMSRNGNSAGAGSVVYTFAKDNASLVMGQAQTIVADTVNNYTISVVIATTTTLNIQVNWNSASGLGGSCVTGKIRIYSCSGGFPIQFFY